MAAATSKVTNALSIDAIRRSAYAMSIVLFPLMLFVGYLLHPNLLGLERLETAQQLAERFHHNPAYHIGHLIVTFAVPVIVVFAVGTMNRLHGLGRRWGFWGGVFCVFGAFILAVDKGALCLVLSAFDTLPEEQFQEFIPYLQVIVDKKGLLAIVQLLAVLLLGGIVLTVGLIKERVIATWQGALMIVGFLLIAPDIDLIATIGAALIAIACVPWGIRELSRRAA